MNFLAVNRIFQIDSKQTEDNAEVISRNRDGRPLAVHGLQPDRFGLHRHLLGFEIGQAEIHTRQP